MFSKFDQSVSSLVDNVGLYIPIPLALVTTGWTVVAATVPPFDGASVPVLLVPTSVVVVVPVAVGDIVSVDSIPEGVNVTPDIDMDIEPSSIIVGE